MQLEKRGSWGAVTPLPTSGCPSGRVLLCPMGQEGQGKRWQTLSVVILGSRGGCSSAPHPLPAPSPRSQGAPCTQRPRRSLPPIKPTGPLYSSSANGHFAGFPQPQGPRARQTLPRVGAGGCPTHLGAPSYLREGRGGAGPVQGRGPRPGGALWAARRRQPRRVRRGETSRR